MPCDCEHVCPDAGYNLMKGRGRYDGWWWKSCIQHFTGPPFFDVHLQLAREISVGVDQTGVDTIHIAGHTKR